LDLFIVSSVAEDFFILASSFFAEHASLKPSLSLELRLVQLLISLLEFLVLVLDG
jgi:hypothetical protein